VLNNLHTLPAWIRPQLTELVDQAPDGPDWLHEIKYDGYRMHARLDHGAVRLLTRTGLDLDPQISGDRRRRGVAHGDAGLSRRRALRRAPGRLAALLAPVSSSLQYCDHQRGHGRAFHEKACAMFARGHRLEARRCALPARNRGLWRKVKCLHREEFVVVGWTA
jgi:bifunctional non-homologous end joining protein LigD